MMLGIDPGSMLPFHRDPITNSSPAREGVDERFDVPEIVGAVRVAHDYVSAPDIRQASM